MYVLGIIAGVAVGIGAAIVIVKLIRKATHQEGTFPKYDERQMEARGKAYKYAYLTVMVLLGLGLAVYGLSDDTLPVPVAVVFWMIMLMGLLVFVSVSIWTNAYIGMNETFRGSLATLVPVGILNLVFGITNMAVDAFGASVNFGIGLEIIIICIEMITKQLYDRNYTGSDED